MELVEMTNVLNDIKIYINDIFRQNLTSSTSNVLALKTTNYN